MTKRLVKNESIPNSNTFQASISLLNQRIDECPIKKTLNSATNSASALRQADLNQDQWMMLPCTTSINKNTVTSILKNTDLAQKILFNNNPIYTISAFI